MTENSISSFYTKLKEFQAEIFSTHERFLEETKEISHDLKKFEEKLPNKSTKDFPIYPEVFLMRFY